MLPIESNCNAIAFNGSDSDALSDALSEFSEVFLVCEKVFLENRNYFMLF
jgi:hypothetical protein